MQNPWKGRVVEKVWFALWEAHAYFWGKQTISTMADWWYFAETLCMISSYFWGKQWTLWSCTNDLI
jgi:hypothetical protein